MTNTPILLFDFSMTLLFPRGVHQGSLNQLHKEGSQVTSYSFLDHFMLNEEMLDLLKEKSVKDNNYIFTTGTIQEVAVVQEEIKPLFTRIFTVPEIGITKSNPEAYRHIARAIDVLCRRITFIDDSQTNINAAREAGTNVIHFTSNADVIPQLEQLLN